MFQYVRREDMAKTVQRRVEIVSTTQYVFLRLVDVRTAVL